MAELTREAGGFVHVASHGVTRGHGWTDRCTDEWTDWRNDGQKKRGKKTASACNNYVLNIFDDQIVKKFDKAMTPMITF